MEKFAELQDAGKKKQQTRKNSPVQNLNPSSSENELEQRISSSEYEQRETLSKSPEILIKKGISAIYPTSPNNDSPCSDSELLYRLPCIGICYRGLGVDFQVLNLRG